MTESNWSMLSVEDSNSLSPGEQLRAVRERAGWSVERLAGELCLPVERLRALERDEHASFGGVVFVRGYLRRAALLLGRPAQEFIAAYEAFAKGTNPAEIVPSLPPGRLPRRGPPAWIGPLAGGVAVVGLIASTWWLMAPSDHGDSIAAPAPTRAPGALEFTMPEEPRVARAEAIPDPADSAATSGQAEAAEDISATTVTELPPAAAPQPAVSVVEIQAPEILPPGTIELRFEFNEDCWVEVIDAEERRLAYRLYRAGDLVRLRGKAPVSVFLGNADGVRLAVDGTAVPLRPARRDGTARLTVGGGAG